MGVKPTRSEVLDLVMRNVSAVMAVEATRIHPDTRLSDDLHADSLDRVEVLERVEHELRRRGARVRVPEDELASLETVDQVAHRVHFHTGTGDHGR